MTEQFYLILGTLGSVISVAGNLPMLIHLVKTKDSTGQSLLAWSIWELANLMLLIYAIHINDIVFSLLQTARIIFVAVIMGLVIKYRRKSIR